MNEPMARPKVTVIVPVYNGVSHIEACISTIMSQDYPKDRLEVFIVDGGSTDGTRETAEKLIKENPRMLLLDNPKKVKPVALNLAIDQSSGEYICIVDARTRLEPDYISECLRISMQTSAELVGGAMRPVSDTFIGKVIAAARFSRFGLGGARGHNPSYEGSVDSVYLGLYRKEVFDRVGLFDEELVRGQDIEMSCRIIRAGGQVYLSPGIKSSYYCRDNLAAHAKQMFRTGMWNIVIIQRNPDAFTIRHWVPFGFVGTLIALVLLSLAWRPLLYVATGILTLYVAVNLFVSTLLSIRKGLRYLPVLPVVFACMHFPYGFGTIVGLFRFGFPISSIAKGLWHSLRSELGE